MSEAKLAPSLPDWMVEHANRYLSSGGTDGHMFKPTQPGRPDMTVPSLLLTTTGRKSGEKFIFPLYYGKTGNSYIVVASKGGAPQHPNWYRNLVANPEVDVQVGTAKMKARARTATGEERTRLWQEALRRLPAKDRARDPGGGAGSRPLDDQTSVGPAHGSASAPLKGEIKRCSSRKPAAVIAARSATRSLRPRSRFTPATAPTVSG
jgi:deazaflavin-dependent oxidoreductase (nitroreductase family)